MTKLIPIIVVVVLAVGCASDKVMPPTTDNPLKLSSVNTSLPNVGHDTSPTPFPVVTGNTPGALDNVEAKQSSPDAENLLLLEACLDLEVRLMEKKLEFLLLSPSVYTAPGEVVVDSIEGHIDRIGKESRDALQSCLERR